MFFLSSKTDTVNHEITNGFLNATALYWKWPHPTELLGVA